jgi:formiminotetrahydrofolate cyclodeaminase
MSMNEMSVRDFASALAAKQSVPGGGGASALVAAVGTALGSMVGAFTLGKKKYAEVEPDIIRLMDEAEALREQLLGCIDEDAAAFEPLSRAYGIPKDAPERDETMEKCLRDAAAVPMKILELSCRAIELHREFAEKGSVLMVSDAGTGVALCRSAMDGAALNVKVNTKLMADRGYADEINARTDELLSKYRAIADEVYSSVMRRYA